MAAHGKRYRQARGAIDREQAYTPVEAVRLLKDAPAAKFDETVEVHMNLGLNVRHADEQLRGTMMLPHGTGREQRVAVFAEGDKAREAEEAGADVVGSADLAKRIEDGFTDFDVAIATPDQMGNVGRLGRVLGPRGLMPNPKTGTVTFDVAKAVRDAKAGKLEYRTDRGANVHIPIGKKSFDERALVENYAALIDEIVRAKPAAAKGRYIKKITLTSTMGPGIHVDPTRTRDIADELDGHTAGGRAGHGLVNSPSPQTTGSRKAEVQSRRPPGRAPPLFSEPATSAGSFRREGGEDAERGQGTRRLGADGQAPQRRDADRRGLPRPDHAPDRRPAREVDRERGEAVGRQEHPHAPRGRGRRGGCAAGAARGPVGDRVHRGGRRHGRRRQGTGRLGP